MISSRALVSLLIEDCLLVAVFGFTLDGLADDLPAEFDLATELDLGDLPFLLDGLFI